MASHPGESGRAVFRQYARGEIAMSVPSDSAFLDVSAYRGHVHSNGLRPASGGAYDVREPASDTLLTQIGLASAGDVAAAALAARQAQRSWAALPYAERAAIFRRAAQVL